MCQYLLKHSVLKFICAPNFWAMYSVTYNIVLYLCLNYIYFYGFIEAMLITYTTTVGTTEKYVTIAMGHLIESVQ